MRRANGTNNGQNGKGLALNSTPTDGEVVDHPSNGHQHIDRQTSALNRRILPHGVDGRSREAKRLVGLVQDFAKQVDDPNNPVTRARLMGAALLVMQQESMAHRVAAGQAVDPDDVVRIHHATERALARLGS